MFKKLLNLNDANTEVSRLTSLLETTKTEHATALAAVQAQVTEKETTITQLTGQVTTLTGERDSARTELKAAQDAVAAKDTELTTLKSEKTTVEQRAAELSATVGSKAPIGADPGAKSDDGKVTLESAWNKNFLSRAKS